jgi:hypothetical protein
MKRAGGLGKRRAEEELNAEPQVYFPIEDGQDEIQQAAVMLAHAELSLEEPEKCVPLLRAVVHECDRIGKLKELLEDGEPLPEFEAEQIESLQKLELTDEFYRVFGDSLFRLACLETFNENLADANLLEASLERYALGLESHPKSESLQYAQYRAEIFQKIINKDVEWLKVAEKWLDSVKVKRETDNILPALETLDSIATHVEGENLAHFAAKLVELCKDSEKVAVRIGLLKSLDYIVDFEFDHDNYEACKAAINQTQQTLRAINLEDLQENNTESHKTILLLIAQHHLWRGCLAEAEGISSEADEQYNNAVDIWRQIEKAYDTPIPDHILELEIINN